MTTVVLFRQGKALVGYRIIGHSTAGAEDQEGCLCCAAVTSAAYMAANTLSEILHLPLHTEVEDGFMEVRISEPAERGQAVLEGFAFHIRELIRQYPGRVRMKIETAEQPSSSLEELQC